MPSRPAVHARPGERSLMRQCGTSGYAPNQRATIGLRLTTTGVMGKYDYLPSVASSAPETPYPATPVISFHPIELELIGNHTA